MSLDSFSAPPQTNAYGLYPLQAYPDCKTPYNGPNRAASAYVVGYGTPHEAVFRKNQRNEAIQHQTTASQGGRLSLFLAPVTKLCSDAVVEVFGK